MDPGADLEKFSQGGMEIKRGGKMKTFFLSYTYAGVAFCNNHYIWLTYIKSSKHKHFI